MLPTTTERVPAHTLDRYNEHIRRQTDASITLHATAGPEALCRRLEELDREWNIERTVNGAAALAAVGR